MAIHYDATASTHIPCPPSPSTRAVQTLSQDWVNSSAVEYSCMTNIQLFCYLGHLHSYKFTDTRT
eukprot:13399397-Ditylum_brightwellii.AAC.1